MEFKEMIDFASSKLPAFNETKLEVYEIVLLPEISLKPLKSVLPSPYQGTPTVRFRKSPLFQEWVSDYEFSSQVDERIAKLFREIDNAVVNFQVINKLFYKNVAIVMPIQFIRLFESFCDHQNYRKTSLMPLRIRGILVNPGYENKVVIWEVIEGPRFPDLSHVEITLPLFRTLEKGPDQYISRKV